MRTIAGRRARSLPRTCYYRVECGSTEDAEIMAMKHRRHPIYGVQSTQSRSYLARRQLLENFLRIVHAAV